MNRLVWNKLTRSLVAIVALTVLQPEFTQGMEKISKNLIESASRNYIQQRRDLYQREDGVGFFIEDGKRFFTDNPDWKELYDYAYIYYINDGYNSYWANENDYRLCEEFILNLISFWGNTKNHRYDNAISLLLNKYEIA